MQQSVNLLEEKPESDSLPSLPENPITIVAEEDGNQRSRGKLRDSDSKKRDSDSRKASVFTDFQIPLKSPSFEDSIVKFEYRNSGEFLDDLMPRIE